MTKRKQKTAFNSRLDRCFSTSKSTRRVLYTACVVYFLFMVVVNSLVYVRGKQIALREVYARRTASATLGAVALNETFERIKDVGVGFAERRLVQTLVAEGRWDEAVAVLNASLANFSYIDRIFFADTQGVLKADVPSLPDIRGVNFSWRDWYEGVSKEWKPYISEVYKRTGAPQVNVVAVAIPLESDEGNVMGILVMQIRLESLISWARNISLGQETTVYLVDHKGHVAVHSMRSPQDDIVDLSRVPHVQRVLVGETGANMAHNDATRQDVVVAYAPIADYGWGVIVEQPAAASLRQYDLDMLNNIILQLAIFAFGLLSLGFVAVMARQLILLRQREKACLESVGDALIGLDTHWNIILWNRAAEEMIGWKEAEVLGKPFRSIISVLRKRDYKPHESFISEAIESKQTQSPRGGAIILRQDGEEIVVNAVASPIIDDEGVVVGCILDFRLSGK